MLICSCTISTPVICSVTVCSTCRRGVHFHEVELAILVEQELDGAGIFVVDSLGGEHAKLAHVCALLIRELGRGRDFNQLLVAPLDRAVAFEQMDDVAVLVAQHLYLDVARVDDRLSMNTSALPKALVASDTTRS